MNWRELVYTVCLLIEMPWMVGGTGFLVWEMINKLRSTDEE